MPGEMQMHCPGPLRDSRAAVMPTPFGNMVTLKFILILVAHPQQMFRSDGAGVLPRLRSAIRCTSFPGMGPQSTGKERLTNPLAAD